MPNEENADILSLMRGGQEETAIAQLYNYFPMILKFIRNNGGDRSDAEDIFQECLMVFYRNSLNKDFELTCQAHSYVFKIAKYKWKDELIKKNRNYSMNYEIEMTDELDFEKQDLENEKFNVLEKVIQSLSKKCMDILEMYYYKGFRIQAIAEKLGYSSTNSAKTQKYKCMEQAKLKLSELRKSES